MPISKARHEANEEYNKSVYESINLRLYKGDRDIIRAAAEHQGESLNAYIKGAIAARMAREGHGEGFGIKRPKPQK